MANMASGLGVLLCLACLALPLTLSTPPPPTGDSLELADDKDLVFEDILAHDSVVCPRPMCECRHAGSGGIAAKCSTLDFKGQRFQGVVNHFEVSNAPELDNGLFLVNNSLRSLGLQFLTSVKISNASIKGLSLSTFDGLTELYDVDLSDNHIMIPHRDLFQKNPSLRKLSLRGNPLNVAQVVENSMEKSHLLNSSSLNELDLSRCQLAFLSQHMFSRMRHLERLLLVGNGIKAIHPEALAGLGELEELDLSTNEIHTITTAMFANNTELTELRLRNNSLHSLRGVEILGLDELDVAENWFEEIGSDTFLGFAALTRLNLSDNAISRIHPDAFKPLRHLQDLDLSGNDIKGALPRELFAACEVLETLNLADNPSMSLPVGGFAGQFSALYQLDLSLTNLTTLDDDSFLGMDHLTILNLSGNNLYKIGAGVLRRLPQLSSLDLSDNYIEVLDSKAFETNGFLRHLDLSGNPLTAVSPQLFAGTPYLRWLDLSHCRLSSLWDRDAQELGQGQDVDRATLLRKLSHLNVAGNNITTLRPRDMTLFSGLTVLDISGNPLECSKELHFLMEWLVKNSVTPRVDRRAAMQTDLMHAVEDMMEEEHSLLGRWSAVYDALCGERAFASERARLQSTILASSSPSTAAPARKGITQAELDDIKTFLGEKKLPVPSADADEADSDEDEDGFVEDPDEDDEEDEDEDEDEYDDSNLIVDNAGNGTDYLAFTHRGSPYLWPVLTIGALLATTVLVVSNVVVCLVRRRRARRYARLQSTMFCHGGVPGSFIKQTKKDGGFVYKKLYEDTTMPVFVPPPQPLAPQARTFRFPLDPSDLLGHPDTPAQPAQRV